MLREYSVRVDVLRNNARLTSLSLLDDPVIDCDSSAEIKTSMAGTFLQNADVNWLTDELMPIQIINGVETPIGIFPIGTTVENTDENGLQTVAVEAYDRALILRQKKTEDILHLSAGTNYIAAIEALLVDAGIKLYLATKTTEVLSTDREDWEIGTPYLTIINTLLAEIGYDDIFFNPNGLAILRPIKLPSAANIDHEYGTTEELRVLLRPTSTERDIFDTPNVFIVICDNPDLPTPLISTAVNDNLLSSLSTVKRGRRIAGTYKVDNTPNQAALDDYAQRLCNSSMMAAEVATVYSVNLPGHSVKDTVAINHPDIYGIFQETAWSLTLAPGQSMSHTLRRLILI